MQFYRHTENITDRPCDQRGCFKKKNDNKKHTQNRKEIVEISKPQERKVWKIWHTQGIIKARETEGDNE